MFKSGNLDNKKNMIAKSKLKKKGQAGRNRSILKARSPLVLFFLLLIWSICLGWGISSAMGNEARSQLFSQASTSGTVDPVSSRYQLGQQLYLENCASCHIGISPAVFPTETWRQLLLDRQHYGKQLPKMNNPTLLLVWDYLQSFSSPQLEKQPIPYRFNESSYLKALHPRVKLPEPVQVSSCVSCHPNVTQYNFRTLTPEWEKSP